MCQLSQAVMRHLAAYGLWTRTGGVRYNIWGWWFSASRGEVLEGFLGDKVGAVLALPLGMR